MVQVISFGWTFSSNKMCDASVKGG